ncbi:MAG: uroporphyrinogen decarboxylase family protein [Syntrophomonas sp.]
MTKLMDYPCKHKNAFGFSQRIIEQTGVAFPEAYYDSPSLADLAVAVKNDQNLPFCMLPFCNTIEAEAMGAKIALGDARISPRPKEYAFSTFEDLLHIPPIDFSKGRIQTVLEACSFLKSRGEKVVIGICGPYSIISCLMDLSVFFKGWLKNPDLTETVFELISDNLVRYCQAACQAEVDIISYADPAGSLKIVGPKYAEKTTRLFTVPFLTRVLSLTGHKCLIHLCPKTALILKGLALMDIEEIRIPENIAYADALLMNLGKKRLIGQACIKDTYFNTISGGTNE